MSRTDHPLTVRTKARGTLAKDLGKIGKEGKKAGAGITAGFIKAQLAMGGLKLVVRGTFRLFKSMTTDAIRQIDEIGKASEKLGVGVEFLSEMAHVADLAGTNLQVVKTGIKTLAKTLLDAQRGSKEMVDSFTDLGLSMEDVNRLARGPLEGAFTEVIGQLGDMEEGSKRLAIAQKLLGRSGEQLGVIIKGGAEEMRKGMEDARKLGLSISASEFKLAAAANDAIARFTGSITGLKRTLAVEFMPQITRGLETVASFVAANRDEIVSSVASAIRSVGSMILTALEEVSTVIAGLMDTVMDFRIIPSSPVVVRDDMRGKGEVPGEGKRKTAVREAFADFRETLKEMEKLAKKLGKKTGDEWVKAIIDEVKRDQAELRRASAAAIKEMTVVPFELPESRGKPAKLQRRGYGFHDIPAVKAEAFARPLEEEVALIREKNVLAREMLRLDHEYSRLHAELGEIVGLTNEEWKEAAAAITDYTEAKREQAREGAKEEGAGTFGGGVDKSVAAIRDLTSAETLGALSVNTLTEGFVGLFDAITTGSMSAGEAFKAFGRDVLKMIQKLAMQRLVAEVLGAAFGAPAGTTTAPAKTLQHGGVALSAREVTVGDVPEAIIPLSQLPAMIGKLAGKGGGDGGGATFQTQINVRAGMGADGQQIAVVVAAKVDEAMRRFRGFRRAIANTGGLA